MYHAFFSKKAADRFGYIVYSKADGSTVNVTIVSEKNKLEHYLWDDVEYIGEVVKLVETKAIPMSEAKGDAFSKTVNLLKECLVRQGHDVKVHGCPSCKEYRLYNAKINGADKKNPFGLN
jgi:hypothetical protein